MRCLSIVGSESEVEEEYATKNGEYILKIILAEIQFIQVILHLLQVLFR